LGEILGIACFSKDTTVHVQGRDEPVALRELNVGDWVLASSGRTRSYQPVYAFGHYNPDKLAEFIQIQTTATQNKPLELTGNHLVFLADQKAPMRADAIQVGDVLATSTWKDNGEQDKTATQREVVTTITTVRKRGVYAPLTPDGILVVNEGIVASTYISLQDNQPSKAQYVELQGGIGTKLSHQTYAQIGFAPLRLLCQGISSQLCSTTTNYDHDGLSWYVNLAIEVHGWAHEQSIVLQSLVLGIIMIATGICYGLECMFLGASYAPLLVLVATTLGYQTWNTKKKKKKNNNNKCKTV
jgi:hypothetical protein